MEGFINKLKSISYSYVFIFIYLVKCLCDRDIQVADSLVFLFLGLIVLFEKAKLAVDGYYSTKDKVFTENQFRVDVTKDMIQLKEDVAFIKMAKTSEQAFKSMTGIQQPRIR
jgi:hypothetical protein